MKSPQRRLLLIFFKVTNFIFELVQVSKTHAVFSCGFELVQVSKTHAVFSCGFELVQVSNTHAVFSCGLQAVQFRPYKKIYNVWTFAIYRSLN